ncbi:integrating conjugative element protein [Enterobacter sp. DTU_2021_1002640_1_SI_PRY_ASU_LCPMC_013]|uniref:integrating conjugative element protein n=1 Tax=Enterobacter sp. DTU_2021_1002640_1_SI_PRY_ASU_LCPMC_013 TaxID=3077940 RepID=UPI0028E70365|nr:integrating conjugative element protein [Enterobacter sp. DTU_2021_1002640_1_SI_PRY_ASU_LCPMC_013]WNU99019.1 integrating conjugative element protein [Enterobacter sp. DTU_2021_1002640_1_SI_PRY_ASU_LCPMC_013]
MTSSPLTPAVHKYLRRGLLVYALTAASSGVVAQTSVNDYGLQHRGSVIGDDVLYSIGGGRAVSMTGAANMRSIGVGTGWNSNLICGDMSLTTTLQNQLNGITNGFQTIMSNVIQNATSAVASLPALIIQRADPALYNLLSNGVLQARLDFDRSKLTCRAIANRMADTAGGQLGWDQLAEGMALKKAVASTDAVSAIEEAESSKGNEGVPWVGGNNAGGTGQAPVRVVADVTRAGYNLVNGRSIDDTSSIDSGSCGDRLTCQTWSSPQAAVTWATRVLGEQEQRTCESCTKTQTTPGVGLTPLIQEEYEARLEILQELISGSQPMSFDNLQKASSTSLPITRGVIEALRDEPDQDILARRLASEVALASVLEKALLLQRTLLTGRMEPNVAANEMAQDAVTQESNILDREINNLRTELELRRELANNSPMQIIQRHSTRAAGSRGVYQGDPIPNRLDELQRPQSGGSNP